MRPSPEECMPRTLIAVAVLLSITAPAAADDNMVVDLSKFCATTPRATVMSAAERALGIKMPRGR